MDLDLDRLSKILGRLGSSFAGERAAAAAKASEMVRSAGTTWDALLSPRALPSPVGQSSREHLHTFRDAARDCLNSDAPITDWEREFLGSLPGFPHLSGRQAAVLERLCRKCGVAWPQVRGAGR